uniref:dachshund homolog 2-like isoform X2 n=1 Tax=Myxine glutinosa TaxID=7769 RepID=UPI00358DF987
MAVPAPLVPPSAVMSSPGGFRGDGKSEGFGPAPVADAVQVALAGSGRRPQEHKVFGISSPPENLALRDLYWADKTACSTPSPTETSSSSGGLYPSDGKLPLTVSSSGDHLPVDKTGPYSAAADRVSGIPVAFRSDSRGPFPGLSSSDVAPNSVLGGLFLPEHRAVFGSASPPPDAAPGVSQLSRGMYRMEPSAKAPFSASPQGDLQTPDGQFDKKVVYCTPPPVENTAANNECHLVELHGAKVASFTVNGQELICLPQAFDLFLKPLVGGLHTVYTKLKRLHIVPVVCNVEQVRVLRGLGAIQPGVNRCKLISRQDFETLYGDCTNTSSRPGRPPKRSHGLLSPEGLIPHAVSGLLSPAVLSPTGSALGAVSTASVFPEALKLKKLKLEALNGIQGTGSGHRDVDGTEHGTGETVWDREKHLSPKTPLSSPNMASQVLPVSHVASLSHPLSQLQQSPLFTNGLEHIGGALPLMMMSHPLLPVTLPHAASVSMAISHMSHLGNAVAAGSGELQLQPPRLDHALVKERSEDCSSPSPAPSPERRLHKGPRPVRLGSPAHSHGSDRLDEGIGMHGMDKGAGLQGVALPPDFPAAFLFADSLSSTETLLANIQGLLKVAADSARVQDKQAQLEKSELRVELLRERESRESLEREFAAEQRARELAQKRLKKEKKTKRKLQEALQVESKRREQAEQALSQASTEGLRVLRENLSPQLDGERSGQAENERVNQDSRMFFKNPGLY